MTEKSYGGQTGFGSSSAGVPSSVNSKVETKVVNKKRKTEDLDIEETEEISEKDIQDYIKAGKTAKEIKYSVMGFVKRGMKLLEIAEKIEGEMEKKKVKPAFPVNLSLNENAAHYTPIENDETIAEGLLKIDFGVEVNGKIADLAFSVDLSEDKKYKEMIELNEKVLDNAISKIHPGCEMKVIGNTITETLKKNVKGYHIITNLTGHSLAEYDLHSGLTVLNVANEDNMQLKNIAIAIEPFLTTSFGEGRVQDGKFSEIFVLQHEKNIRDSDARKMLAFIIEEYKTKPFCKRWLIKQGFKKIDFCLRELVRAEILHNFPVLVERGKQPVSQAEHTVLILKDKVVVTTR